MLKEVNIEEVRGYNTTLKHYRDKAANLNAEIEYTNKELDALCAELTAELGKPVTRDNIEQIYNEQVDSINSTLQSGNAVLAKIASEEQAVNTVATPTPAAAPMNTTTPINPMGQPMTNNVVQQPLPTPAPAPVQGGVFNGQASAMPGQLPPMFNIT